MRSAPPRPLSCRRHARRHPRRGGADPRRRAAHADHREPGGEPRGGHRVFLKLDNLQATGAFKERGAANRLALLTPREREAGVIAMSAGNHAQAVARHAQLAGVKATIVMPKFTPATKVVRTESWGARVVLHGETLAEAAAHAHDLALREGLVFIHPYDDAAVIAGQGTMALEMLEDAPEIEALVVPVGGGGLCAGVASGRWPSCGRACRSMAWRSKATPPWRSAWRASRSPSAGPPSPRASRCATSARRRSPSSGAWGSRCCWCPSAPSSRRSRCSPKAPRWSRRAPARRGSPPSWPIRSASRGRVVGTTVCGGNIDARALSNVLLRQLLRDGRILRLHFDIPDRPGVLADIAKRISDVGGNVIEVKHQQLFGAPTVQSTELHLMVEVRDAAQGDAIIAALEAGDYVVRRG
jgi:threonine dehydratase